MNFQVVVYCAVESLKLFQKYEQENSTRIIFGLVPCSSPPPYSTNSVSLCITVHKKENLTNRFHELSHCSKMLFM